MRPIDGDALHAKICKDSENNYGSSLNITQVLLYIETAPTVEVEPVRHGWWIPTEYDSYADGAPVWDKWECSECGHEHSGEEYTLTAFCPACGTRMNGGEIEV